VLDRVVTGFWLTLPLVLGALMVGQLLRAVRGLLQPVLDALPGVIFRHEEVRFAVLCLSLALILFALGSTARTRTGKRLGRWLEQRLLNRLPLYPRLRGAVAGLAGRGDGVALRPVLVATRPGVSQFGFLIERHDDGRLTVFVPSAPNPANGDVLVVDAALVRELDVPGHRVLNCVGQWGDGAAALVAPADRAEPR
jgi:uncharacterized membrane protein